MNKDNLKQGLKEKLCKIKRKLWVIPTTLMFLPTTVFKNVDLPTFGLPIIATKPDL